jgi:hypothetical protein
MRLDEINTEDLPIAFEMVKARLDKGGTVRLRYIQYDHSGKDMVDKETIITALSVTTAWVHLHTKIGDKEMSFVFDEDDIGKWKLTKEGIDWVLNVGKYP